MEALDNLVKNEQLGRKRPSFPIMYFHIYYRYPTWGQAPKIYIGYFYTLCAL